MSKDQDLLDTFNMGESVQDLKDQLACICEKYGVSRDELLRRHETDLMFNEDYWDAANIMSVLALIGEAV